MLNVMKVKIEAPRELPGWLRGAAILGTAALLAVLEFRRTSRHTRREPKAQRTIRNLAIAAGAAVVMQSVESPLALRLSRYVYDRRWGVAPRLVKSALAQTALSVILLDYGLYVWHVLTHKVPFLWRFHLVHHIDLDLDASTGIRFHYGEMLLSVPWRLAQIAVTGASPLAYSTWQAFLFSSVLFHHANVEIPPRAERILAFFFMTPRLHAIHHEAKESRSNSNWSSGLAIWDLMHGTQQWDQKTGIIGVPAYLRTEDVTLAQCLTLPFERQRADWVSASSRPIAAPQR
jgi:sterol desaturase/sphingolipid hydroxylase (fatty acid hydroxylase superfamily)